MAQMMMQRSRQTNDNSKAVTSTNRNVNLAYQSTKLSQQNSGKQIQPGIFEYGKPNLLEQPSSQQNDILNGEINPMSNQTKKKQVQIIDPNDEVLISSNNNHLQSINNKQLPHSQSLKVEQQQPLYNNNYLDAKTNYNSSQNFNQVYDQQEKTQLKNNQNFLIQDQQQDYYHQNQQQKPQNHSIQRASINQNQHLGDKDDQFQLTQSNGTSRTDKNASQATGRFVSFQDMQTGRLNNNQNQININTSYPQNQQQWSNQQVQISSQVNQETTSLMQKLKAEEEKAAAQTTIRLGLQPNLNPNQTFQQNHMLIAPIQDRNQDLRNLNEDLKSTFVQQDTVKIKEQRQGQKQMSGYNGYLNVQEQQRNQKGVSFQIDNLEEDKNDNNQINKLYEGAYEFVSKTYQQNKNQIKNQNVQNQKEQNSILWQIEQDQILQNRYGQIKQDQQINPGSGSKQQSDIFSSSFIDKYGNVDQQKLLQIQERRARKSITRRQSKINNALEDILDQAYLDNLQENSVHNSANINNNTKEQLKQTQKTDDLFNQTQKLQFQTSNGQKLPQNQDQDIFYQIKSFMTFGGNTLSQLTQQKSSNQEVRKSLTDQNQIQGYQQNGLTRSAEKNKQTLIPKLQSPLKRDLLINLDKYENVTVSDLNDSFQQQQIFDQAVSNSFRAEEEYKYIPNDNLQLQYNKIFNQQPLQNKGQLQVSQYDVLNNQNLKNLNNNNGSIGAVNYIDELKSDRIDYLKGEKENIHLSKQKINGFQVSNEKLRNSAQISQADLDDEKFNEELKRAIDISTKENHHPQYELDDKHSALQSQQKMQYISKFDNSQRNQNIETASQQQQIQYHQYQPNVNNSSPNNIKKHHHQSSEVRTSPSQKQQPQLSSFALPVQNPSASQTESVNNIFFDSMNIQGMSSPPDTKEKRQVDQQSSYRQQYNQEVVTNQLVEYSFNGQQEQKAQLLQNQQISINLDSKNQLSLPSQHKVITQKVAQHEGGREEDPSMMMVELSQIQVDLNGHPLNSQERQILQAQNQDDTKASQDQKSDIESKTDSDKAASQKTEAQVNQVQEDLKGKSKSKKDIKKEKSDQRDGKKKSNGCCIIF